MRRSTHWILTAWAVVAAATLGAPVDAPGQVPHRDGDGNMTFALTGDAIISRKLSVYDEPEFREIRDLMRGAGAAFTNAEILFLDYEQADVIPAAQSGGTYMRAAPEIARELVWMGVDMVSLANNHTMDYGVGGLRANRKWIEEAGLLASGAGENLAEARAPGYLETSGGRVAMISVASSFADAGRAGPQRKDLRGRPGLSPIRHQTVYYVPEQRFEELKGLKAEMEPDETVEGDELRILGSTFRKGDRFEVRTFPHEGDMEEIAAVVRDAKRQANWVMVTSHSHDSGETRDVPAEFVVTFARAMIDAGADMWVGHGPHVLRGIEIYKGKPIFYSLGDFIFQNETVELQPADNYLKQGLGGESLPSEFYDAREENSEGGFPVNPLIWEAVVAIPDFREGELAEVRLHPVTLGYGLPRPQRGRPLAAKGELARKIIGDLQRLSRPFGTTIEFENGIGVIRIDRAAASH